MLPMIAIAVLACVVGYYIKNKFCKVDEDEENKKEKDLQRDLEKMRFPPPKANKPWLNMPPTNSEFVFFLQKFYFHEMLRECHQEDMNTHYLDIHLTATKGQIQENRER